MSYHCSKWARGRPKVSANKKTKQPAVPFDHPRPKMLGSYNSVLENVCEHADCALQCHPSIGTIAYETNLSKSTVKRAIKWLSSSTGDRPALLHVRERTRWSKFDNEMNDSNLYTVLTDPDPDQQFELDRAKEVFVEEAAPPPPTPSVVIDQEMLDMPRWKIDRQIGETREKIAASRDKHNSVVSQYKLFHVSTEEKEQSWKDHQHRTVALRYRLDMLRAARKQSFYRQETRGMVAQKGRASPLLQENPFPE